MQWIETKYRGLFALLLLLSGLWLAPKVAYAATTPPLPPHTIYGTVTIDGTAAANGTQLTVLVTHSLTETVSLSTTTFSSGGQPGYYLISVPADNVDSAAYDGGRAGDNISFSVAGVNAAQSATFTSGSNQPLNLTITSPTATPTNTPVPPTATPTNTVPPTATPTNTVPPTATPTDTVPPTATPTDTVPPSATPTDTVPPTATPTNTVPPTATPTNTVPPTATPTDTVPPTATPTNTVPPTATPTNTVPPTATPTNTVPPTATPTNTVPPTATPTNTAVPPTATNTPVVPTATATSATCPLVVTSVADSGAGSLRQAIASANPSCSQITFGSGVAGQTIRLASALVIAKNVTIDGSGRQITISGDTNNDGTGDVPVFTINGGIVSLSHLTIADGFGADGLGGGISISPSARVTILQSTIRDNVSDNGSFGSMGGGIYNTGILTLTNSTVTGNQAANLIGFGGGLYSGFGGVATIRFSTITGNSAPSSGVGGGIVAEGGTITLIGSIVSGNSAETGAEASVSSGGSLTLNAYNVLGVSGDAGLDGATPGATDRVPAGALNTLINPSLADNGGDSLTYAVVTSGVAYDAVPANSALCGTTITVDQRDLTRPIATGCDAGAFEAQNGATATPTLAPPTATHTAIPPTATLTNTPVPPTATASNTPVPPTATATATATHTSLPPTATLTNTPLPPTATPTNTVAPPTATPTNTPVAQRDCTQLALQSALAAPVNGTVTLDGTCRYLLTVATFDAGGSNASGFYIPSVTVVEGNGATIERQNGAPKFRLLLLNRSGSTLRNLTLRGGDSIADGGGFFSYQDVTLENVRLENNIAAGRGGGGYVIGSTTLRNSLISNNQATGTGGGLYITRYTGTSSTLLVSNSRLLGNLSSSNGGGIYHYGQNLQINNSIFARNKSGAVNGGAQLHTAEQGSVLALVNDTFSDSSQNSNPAIFVWSAVTMTNTIVANHQIGLGTAGGSLYPVSEDYNLFAGNGTDVRVIYNGSNITRGTHSVVALSPRFADAASDNYRLAANSPAIDAGTSGGPASDADGQPRPAGGVADVGAYEFQGQPTVALQIVKEAPAWIVSNRAGRYALTVFNASKLTAENVQIVETLPTGATYVNGSANNGGVFASGVLSWTVGSLPPGASKRVEYQASANQSLVSADYRAISGNIVEAGKPITTALNTRIVAALDFQPNPDGFAFPNYGDSPDSDLTVDDMVFIFGADKVCKSQNPCVLTAAAEAWRQSWLALVQGGHCAGMAMGSLEIFANDLLAPPSFQAGANVTYDLNKSNARRFVALYATTQTQVPVNYPSLQSQGWAWVPANTPAGVLNVLLSNFQNPAATDRYRLSIYRPPAAGGGAGHTVVPYAIEQLNNDEFLIYIYENNAPNDFTRAIRINRTANSWSYVGTTAPDQPLYSYYGVAADANINLVSWRWATSFPKRCDGACAPPAASQVQGAGQDLIDGELIEFQMDGEGYLLVTRNDGKRVGFDAVTGDWINEIDGAERTEVNTGLGLNLPPILRIPHSAGATYRVQVSNRETASGNLNATANVNIFGSNFVVRLTGLQLNSPELTPVDLGGGLLAASVQEGVYDQVNVTFDPTEKRLTYQASSSDGDTPAVSMAVNNPNGSDYQFTVDSLQLGNDQSMAVAFDSSNGQLSVENNNGENGSYSVAVERINQDGTTDSFVNDQVSDGDGVGVILQVGDSWDGTTPPAVEENTTPTLPGLEQIFLPVISR